MPLYELDSVLVVDDNPSVLSAVRRTLRLDPYRVFTANGPDAALGWLARQRFAAIIADLNMPGMTGIELLQLIRPSYPNTVRILLSGELDLEASLRAVNHGQVFRILTKPWDDYELRNTLRDAVALHHDHAVAL